jgi:hypothetical protein
MFLSSHSKELSRLIRQTHGSDDVSS